MKIFGIGLNKIGTKILGACLKQLGFNHHALDRELLFAVHAGELDSVYSVIDNFDSFEDWPYPLVYKELFFKYGHDAKFILTERACPETWLESLKKHTLGSNPKTQCRKMAYGYDYPHGYEREHLHLYNSHREEVVEFFNSQNSCSSLTQLCWENGDGWDELTEFLEVPKPLADFPHYNSSMNKTRNEHWEENTRLINLQLDKVNKTNAA